MFFSVIVPVYNVEKYLPACIESVLKQSFRDYELILVDDGSKDASATICDEYAKQDVRINVIHKENTGQADARNVGMSQANGMYIIYIDSDDFFISENFLQDVYQKVQETGSDVVLYKFAKFYDETQKMADCTFSLGFADQITDGDQLWYEVVRRDAYYGMAWIKAFRRDFAVSENVIFDKNLICEDMDWNFSLVLQAEKVCAIDQSYVAYRQRTGSVTQTIKLKTLTDFIYTLEKWDDRFRQTDISEKRKAAFMGALAKYYANLLIIYSRLRDNKKEEYIPRLKQLSRLLDYGISTRPIQIRKVYKLIGFHGVIFMLSFLDKLRK